MNLSVVSFIGFSNRWVYAASAERKRSSAATTERARLAVLVGEPGEDWRWCHVDEVLV